jgi:hypothetical protein
VDIGRGKDDALAVWPDRDADALADLVEVLICPEAVEVPGACNALAPGTCVVAGVSVGAAPWLIEAPP